MLLRSPQCRAVPTAFLSPAVMSSHAHSEQGCLLSDSHGKSMSPHVPSERLCVLRPRRTSLISSFTLRAGLGPLTLPQEAQCPLRRPRAPDKGERLCLLRAGVVPSLPLGADTTEGPYPLRCPQGKIVSVAHTVQLSFLSLPQNPSGCPMSPHTPSEQCSIPLRSPEVHVPSGALRAGLAPLRLRQHMPSEGNSVPSGTHKRSMSPHVPTGEGLGLLRAHRVDLVTSLTLSRARSPWTLTEGKYVSSPALRANCVPSDSSGLGVRPNIPSEQRSGLLGPPHSRIVPPQNPQAGSGLLTCPQRMAGPP